MALGKPKLSSKTPDSDDTNALLVEGVHDRFIKAFTAPKGVNRHIILGVLAVDEVVTKEGGARQAKVSLRHIELADGEHFEGAEELLLSLYSGRTGNSALPGTDDKSNQLDLSGLDD